MNKENADKWITALRSGKYKQGRLYLQTTDGMFCCLGVLLDINGVKPISRDGVACRYYDDKIDKGFNSLGTLSDSQRELCDIKTGTGRFCIENGEFNHLTILNDNGKTFEEIADIIKENYEHL